MRLVIAEKPSVAQSLSAVLGANLRRDGYVEGSGWLVSWCFGHLAGLADADYYDASYGKWKLEHLPIIPSSFRFRIAPDKWNQFDILKSLMRREDVTEVINACDAGREGELIFRTVYCLAGCSKPMKRLWISSMEDDAIREGFQNLRPGKEFDGLHMSALCRAKADWLVGINATRYFSLIYGTTLNIGRVMSPTLALLVQRESEIAAFRPDTYYTVNLAFSDFTVSSERFARKQDAQILMEACKGDRAVVEHITHKKKDVFAPELYDLTALQRDANRILGYTAQQTLDYLQSLYEKKLCTYPRTDSRYLSDDMQQTVPAAVLCAAGICGVDAPSTIHAEQVCGSRFVTDHYAILPTMIAGETDCASLPVGEQEILKLLCRQLLMAVSEEFSYQESEVIIRCGGAVFKTTIKRPLKLGWKQYAHAEAKKKWVSGMKTGDTLLPSEVKLTQGRTQPPKHYTEDLLLAAMEAAGQKEMPENIERSGLGTPATRAGILEKLVSSGMVERKKAQKQTHLIPTPLGTALITVLPEQLQSPSLTAQWEHCLSRIQTEELAPEEFMEDISDMIRDLIQNYTPVPGADILFSAEKEVIGKCPRCGKSVTENSKGFFCENKDCRFALWKSSCFFSAKKKTFTKEIAAELLSSGRAMLKDCYSPKTGINYDAVMVLEDDGSRTGFKLVFDNG